MIRDVENNNAPLAPSHLYVSFRFSVEIPGFEKGYFTAVSRPKTSIDLRGHTIKHGQLVVKKAIGVLDDRASQTWFAEMLGYVTHGYVTLPELYRDVVVTEFSRLAEPIRTTIYRRCTLVALDEGELNGGDSENVIETLYIDYQDVDIQYHV